MAQNPNKMQEAVDRLSGQLGVGAGTAIVYSRVIAGQTVSVSLTATVGRTPFEVQDGNAWIAYESRDFIVEAAKLILNGAVTLPQAGDKITDSTGDYGVTVPKPLYLYESIGPDGTVLKIHTKKVG